MLQLKSTSVELALDIQSQSTLVVLMSYNTHSYSGSTFLSTGNRSNLPNSVIFNGSFSIGAGFNQEFIVQGGPAYG
jgi:hypothetical protein